MKYLIILFPIYLSILSCSSFKNYIDNGDRVMLDSSNIKLINGKYRILSISNNDSVRGSLYRYFFDSATNFAIPDSTGYIVLDVIDEKNINVSYIEQGIEIKTKKIRGKLKNGYFVLRRKHSFISIVVTNYYGNQRFRIGLLNSKNLITDLSQVSMGTMIFIIPFYDYQKEFNMEFGRIKDE